MMNLYTIGFTKKSAKEFFEKLIKNKIKRVIDIRLNNSSQLAGFTKGNDLKYFLKAIADIEYVHIPTYAPTKEILTGYKKNVIDWEEYEKKYKELLEKRNILINIDYSIFDDACLLCSEKAPDKCHRRLLAEYIAMNNREIKIIHV